MSENQSEGFSLEEDAGKYLNDGRYTVTFPFLKGFSLTAVVDCTNQRENGKQFLVIKHKSLTGKGEDTSSIPCIHTVVGEVTPEQMEDINSDIGAYKEVLQKRSEKNVQIIDLPAEEKFKAFAIWTAGIAEAGLEAFFIQSQIERFADLSYPLLHPLWKFIIDHDRELLFDFLSYLERNCKVNETWHITSLRANLFTLADMRYQSPKDLEFLIIALIHAGFPVLTIFARWHTFEFKYIKQIVASSLEATELEEYKILFASMNWELRRAVAANPGATRFEEYRKLFADPSGNVRRAVAGNPNAPQFEEYRTFFDVSTPLVRRTILKNPNAHRFEEYKKLFQN